MLDVPGRKDPKSAFGSGRTSEEALLLAKPNSVNGQPRLAYCSASARYQRSITSSVNVPAITGPRLPAAGGGPNLPDATKRR